MRGPPRGFGALRPAGPCPDLERAGAPENDMLHCEMRAVEAFARRQPEAFDLICRRQHGLRRCGPRWFRMWAPPMTPGTLMYLGTIVLLVTGLSFNIADAADGLARGRRPSVRSLAMQWLLFGSFFLKIPYMRDKLLALISIAVLVVGYGVSASISSAAFARNR